MPNIMMRNLGYMENTIFQRKWSFFPHSPIICILEYQIANQITVTCVCLFYAIAKGTNNYHKNYNIF